MTRTWIEGWEEVTHTADPRAYMHPEGKFDEELGWGFQTRVFVG